MMPTTKTRQTLHLIASMIPPPRPTEDQLFMRQVLYGRIRAPRTPELPNEHLIGPFSRTYLGDRAIEEIPQDAPVSEPPNPAQALHLWNRSMRFMCSK